MNERIKKIAVAAMLCALSYVLACLPGVPLVPNVPFLEYDPKDIVIALGGLIYGPMMTVVVSMAVSFLEMVTISTTGIIGFVMNVLSTCAFATVASAIYKKIRNVTGAVVGLASGLAGNVAVMLLWNYLITPIYMGLDREEVAEMLVPYLLPFNLLKTGVNASVTFLLYRPVVTALRKAKLVQPSAGGKKRNILPLTLVISLVLLTCILVILAFNGVI